MSLGTSFHHWPSSVSTFLVPHRYTWPTQIICLLVLLPRVVLISSFITKWIAVFFLFYQWCQTPWTEWENQPKQALVNHSMDIISPIPCFSALWFTLCDVNLLNRASLWTNMYLLWMCRLSTAYTMAVLPVLVLLTCSVDPSTSTGNTLLHYLTHWSSKSIAIMIATEIIYLQYFCNQL